MSQNKNKTDAANGFGVAFFIVNVLLVLNSSMGHIRSLELIPLAAGLLVTLWFLVFRKKGARTLTAKLPAVVLLDACVLLAVFSDTWIPKINVSNLLPVRIAAVVIFLIVGLVIWKIFGKKRRSQAAQYLALEVTAIGLCAAAADTYEILIQMVVLSSLALYFWVLLKYSVGKVEPEKRTIWRNATILLYALFFFLLILCRDCTGEFFAQIGVYCSALLGSSLKIWRVLVLAVVSFAVGFLALVSEEEKNWLKTGELSSDFSLFCVLTGLLLFLRTMIAAYHPGSILLLLVLGGFVVRLYREDSLQSEGEMAIVVFLPHVFALIFLQILLGIGLWQAAAAAAAVYLISGKLPGAEKHLALRLLLGMLAAAAGAAVFYKVHIQYLALTVVISVPAFLMLRFLNRKHPSVENDRTPIKMTVCLLTGLLLLVTFARNGIGITTQTNYANGTVSVSAAAKGGDVTIESVSVCWGSSVLVDDTQTYGNLFSLGDLSLDALLGGADQTSTDQNGESSDTGASDPNDSENTAAGETEVGSAQVMMEDIRIKGSCLTIIIRDSEGVVTQKRVYFPLFMM